MQPDKYQPLHEHFRQIQSRGLKVEAYDVLNALFEAEVHIRKLEAIVAAQDDMAVVSEMSLSDF